MEQNVLHCNKENLKERMEKLSKMSPGELRKIGIRGMPSVPCNGNYVHKAGSFYEGEYPIGRDC